MRTKLLICLFFSFNLSIIANPISIEDARTNALSFFKSKVFKRSKIKEKNRQELNLVFKGSSEQMGYPLYYVFNFTDNSGFVIASGDDSITEVIGYSDDGAFDINNITCDMHWWLSEYERDIKNAIKKGKKVEVLKKTKAPVVEPLIKSRWNQYSPYNAKCPIGKDGKRCLTGCVGTAMAQILYYHRWPQKGYGSFEYEFNLDKDSTTPMKLKANFGNEEYDWKNMLDSYDNVTDEKAISAVATLMLHCGIASQTIYGVESSGGWTTPSAYTSFFRYRRGIKVLYKDDDPVFFVEKLNENLSKNLPVPFGGQSEDGKTGHGFICDGIDSDGYYHFNWGWGGGNNGYFLLTAPLHYTHEQSIVINIEPYKGEIPENQVTINVAKAGTLKNYIYGMKAEYAHSLKITGELNGSDFIVLRDLCGRDFDKKEIASLLKELDLSEATIVNGGEKYINEDDVDQSGTKENVFPSHGLKNTIVEKVIFPNSTKTVGRYSLAYCNAINDIVFSDNIETIDFAAFTFSALKTVSIPDGVKKMGSYVFYCDEKLEEVTMGKGLTAVPYAAFKNCKKLKSVSFGENTVQIAKEAFSGCKNLTSIELPESINAIEDNAFADADALTSIICKIINPQNISEMAFSSQCYKQANLMIPTGTKSLYMSKSGWKNFKNIVEYNYSPSSELEINVSKAGILQNLVFGKLPEKAKSLKITGKLNGSDFLVLRSLAGCGFDKKETNGVLQQLDLSEATIVNGGEIYIDDEEVNSGTEDNVFPIHAFQNTKIRRLVLPKTVSSVSRYAFGSCPELEEIVYNDNIVSIDYAAFTFSGMKKVFVSDCIKKLENCIFYRMKELEEASIGNGVTIIPYKTFFECSKLKTVTLGSNLQRIGNSAFAGCNSIKSVEFPASLITIEDDAFADINNLKTIVCRNTNPMDISEKAFSSDCYKNSKLVVPNGTKNLYMQRVGWKNFENIIESSLTYIDSILKQERKKDIFDLHGRKIKKEQMNKKGIFIINGKKVRPMLL